MILVVGATGQLGSAVVRLLRAAGKAVRVYVRTAEAGRRFEEMGCESYVGDIANPGLAKGPLPRVETLITTATASTPSRPGDRIDRVDGAGVRNLIAAAVEAGSVKQFIYPSVSDAPGALGVPLFRLKRENERLLMESPLNYTIFRLPAFMDVVFPLMGCAGLVSGEEYATVGRPCGFLQRHLATVKDAVLRDGVVHVPGDGSVKQPYIAVEDVARLIVASIGHKAALRRVLDVTGPVALSGEEVARTFERILGRMLKRKYTPAAIFKMLSVGLKPFQPAASNVMAIQHWGATVAVPVRGQEIAAALGVALTTPEAFLRARLGIPG
ncbi:MAG TPA: NmrA family NAD(P)-binding protein [Bryobacteraceae bacterium]|nr:NmrA family NAD(P)-binding protein [Bryobacteraceae bacterium]